MLRKILFVLMMALVMAPMQAQTSDSTAVATDSVPGMGRIIPESKKKVGNDSIMAVEVQHEPIFVKDSTGDHGRVIVGKDTISVILPGKNYSRFDRGLLNYLFVPRGQWMIGATASYGEFDTEDVRVLSLMKDFNFNGKTMSVKPYAAYFYRSNQCAGMKLSFTRNLFELASLSVDFDDDINFTLKDVEYTSDNYSAALFYRLYIGLDNNRRFAVFNEVDLAFAAGYGKFLRYYNGEPRDTRTKSTEVNLSFSPGLCIFVHERVSFNMSFGVFGLYFKNEKQTTNSVEEGSRFSSGANFKFNIFNLNMGIAVHI